MRQVEFDWEEIDRKSVVELWTPDEIFDCVTADSLSQFCEDDRVERKPLGHTTKRSQFMCACGLTPLQMVAYWLLAWRMMER